MTKPLPKTRQYAPTSAHLTYSADKALEALGLPSKIGRADNTGGDRSKQNKDENDSTVHPLQMDLIFSNELDRYSYARGCPTRYTDPTGHECDMSELVAGAAIVLLDEVIAGALAAVVGFTTSATGPGAILAAYKTFELVNVVLAPITFTGTGMMIHACVKDP